MGDTKGLMHRKVNRRSLLQKAVLAAGAVTVGAGLLGAEQAAFAQGGGESLTKGDMAIVRFLAAAELIESDLWQQYAELGGIGDNPPIEIDPNETLNNCQIALSNLDGDGPQYIVSNTIDEISHANFLNGYLGIQRRRPGQLRRVPHTPRQPGDRNAGLGSFATAVRPIQTSAPLSLRRSNSTTLPPSPETITISTGPRTPTSRVTTTSKRSRT
jgi:hypothetical protein